MKRFISLCLATTIWLVASQTSKDNEIQKDYYQSYNYEQIGNYDEAIKVLVPLYNQYKNGYTLNLRLGWLFFKSKRYKDSLDYYQKASIISPNSIAPRLGIIRIYLKTQSYKKVESASQQLLKIDYYNYYANLYIVKALIAQKKYDTALFVVRKMLVLYPTSVRYLEELAKIYKATSNKNLYQIYKDILILDPNNITVSNMKKQSNVQNLNL